MAGPYYFKIVESKHRRQWGGNIEKAEIYEHTQKKLIPLGETRWNTAAYRGPESEIFGFLHGIKRVPDRSYKYARGYYHHQGKRGVKIIQL